MVLKMENWKKILNTVESESNDNILEQIKTKLEKQYNDTYKLWKNKNFDVNYQFSLEDKTRHTLLSIAAYTDNKRVVEALLEVENINVNVRYDGKRPLLHWAAQNGNIGIVEALLKKEGIKVNMQNTYGRTPLHYAAQNGRIGTVEALLKKEGIDVNVQDTYGMTPLHFAAQNGHTEAIKTLLTGGGDPSLQNNRGETPRDLATDKNVKQLLKDAENKNKDRENVSSILNSTKENKLPIMTASAGLLLGLGLCLAYFAGAATLIPVGGVVAIFIAAVVFGTLVGYGVGKFCEKVSEEKQKNPNMGTWDAAQSVLSDVFTAGYSKEHKV
ncbi:MAG: ankyrin repeat domain-containing protein [Rickettsiales bacterium]|jgi:hypothetical protein|nr:ankyrin repeat domain-containing protein [Rickettsiales bacterium]